MTVNIDKIVAYLFITGIILTTNTLTGCYIGITRIEIALALASIAIAVSGGACVNAKKTFWLIIYTVLLLMVEATIYSEMLIEWVRLPLLVISYFLFFSVYKNRLNLLNIFYNTSLVFCSLSTGIYFLVEVLRLDIPYRVTNFPWLADYNSYLMLYYRLNRLVPDYIGPIAVNRNCGLFTEPGLYAVFIVLIMYIYMFELEKKNIIHFIILSISLLTTVSATGLLAFLLLFVFKLLFYEKSLSRRIRVFFGAIIIPIVIIAAYVIIEFKADKHSSSYSSRLFDFEHGMDLFLQRPLLGWGYENKGAFHLAKDIFGGVIRTPRTCSNGIMSLLYQLGMAGAALYYYPVCMYISRNTVKGSYERKKMYMFCIFMIILIMGEPIQYNSLTLAMIAFFISKTNSRQSESYNALEICERSEL